MIGKPPFETGTVKETYERILRCEYTWPVNKDVDIGAKNLVTQILRLNPNERLDLSGIENHEFLKFSPTIDV